ncbi:uncharacterized protein cubi_00287 [Cryptosporidium ubiquitum]|uniref:Histidine kinase/HSP90-like ATPase domain-containing protein n=1 Tax=Cryptosporidium ubiquitum TaxID=857276 RepID=A0A1J4MKK7_9CRYT|nr:uncharacterized protein cubi_00287 [Cryptosporidium ubiquitum]OII74734.1 hypothetical protein cubi_00287 [Cryptosporidium ubiquitum]
MSNISAINFFSENIGITGFDSENAPFMAFKELFDNSIDACNNKAKTEWHDLPKRIQISVNFENLELDDQARINIIVRDTGCGIPLESIDLLGTLFGTNKKINKRDSYYTGQFGVGLKMILLYATQHGEGNVKVKMRMGNKIWKFTLLCNLSDGSFYVGNSESFDHNSWDWITEFSVSMKLSLGLEYLQEKYFSMELYAKTSLKKIQSYLALSKFWNSHISFNFETNMKMDASELRIGDINLSFFDIFKDNFVQYSSNKGSKYKIDTVFGFLKECHVKKESQIDNLEYQSLDKENQSNLNLSNISQTPSLKPGQIYIYRFSNGMPIICKDAEYCEIVTSIKSFIKKKGSTYGMKLVKKDESVESYPENLSMFSGSEFLLPIMVIPTVEFSIRVLFINVKGHGIQYGTLGKSSLKSNVGLSTAIQQSLKSLMKGCQLKFPLELINIKEFNYKSSVEKYSPIISKNLASMVMRSESIVFKSGLFEILSRCDPESSEKLSKLLEGNDEEKLREQLNIIFCKWFISRMEQGPNIKAQLESNEGDSEDYIFEKEENL